MEELFQSIVDDPPELKMEKESEEEIEGSGAIVDIPDDEDNQQ